MNRQIRLLYFKDCPHVEQAREHLREALSRAGLAHRWDETDTRSSDCPERWKGFPSPTVLVDGADIVSGSRAQPGSGSCRMDGAPTSKQIGAALAADKSRYAGLSALPAAAAGALPASFCPACYPALAGFVGSLGLGASADRIIAPLTIALLLIALAGLGFQASRNRNYWPLAAGAAGAAAMYAGQFVLALPAVKIGGIALLVAASFWNVIPKLRKRTGHDCPACAGGR